MLSLWLTIHELTHRLLKSTLSVSFLTVKIVMHKHYLVQEAATYLTPVARLPKRAKVLTSVSAAGKVNLLLDLRRA